MEGYPVNFQKFLEVLADDFDKYVKSQGEEEKDYKILSQNFIREFSKAPKKPKSKDGQSTVSKAPSDQWLYSTLEELQEAEVEKGEAKCHRLGTRSTAAGKFCGLKATNESDVENESELLCRKCFDAKLKKDEMKSEKLLIKSELIKKEGLELKESASKKKIGVRSKPPAFGNSPAKELKRPTDVPSAASSDKEEPEFEELGIPHFYKVTNLKTYERYIFVQDDKCSTSPTLVGKLKADMEFSLLNEDNVQEIIEAVPKIKADAIKRSHDIGYTKLEDYLQMISEEQPPSEEEAPPSPVKKSPPPLPSKKKEEEDVTTTSGDEEIKKPISSVLKNKGLFGNKKK